MFTRIFAIGFLFVIAACTKQVASSSRSQVNQANAKEPNEANTKEPNSEPTQASPESNDKVIGANYVCFNPSKRSSFGMAGTDSRTASLTLLGSPTIDMKCLPATEDDHVDGVEQALAYYVALQKAGVPTEMHLYAQGGHAFGLRPTKMPITQWPQLVEIWLGTIGVLSR